MCCYMTSGSLNPAISSEAERLRLGRSVFRSLAEPHHSSSWKVVRPAHMWIYMSGDAEKHPHAQTEIQQGKGKHTNAYIYVFHAYIYFHINQTYLLERFTYECDLFCTSSRTNPQKKKITLKASQWNILLLLHLQSTMMLIVTLHFERCPLHLPFFSNRKNKKNIRLYSKGAVANSSCSESPGFFL